MPIEVSPPGRRQHPIRALCLAAATAFVAVVGPRAAAARVLPLPMPTLEYSAATMTARVVRAGDVTGIRYDAFSGTRSVGLLQPGERLDFTYVLSAEGPAQRPSASELGYQGLVGDPFAVGAARGSWCAWTLQGARS